MSNPRLEAAAKAAYQRMTSCLPRNADHRFDRWEDQPENLREDWRAAVTAAIHEWEWQIGYHALDKRDQDGPQQDHS